MLQSKVITKDEIKQGIDDKIRPFLCIEAMSMPRTVLPTIEAFWLATKIIAPMIKVMRPVDMFFATSPFMLNSPTGFLTYEAKEDVINAFLNNIIFIDCNKLMRYNFPLQVACILEELVHALMNVEDEDLVTNIVGLLYSGVKIKDGKYCAI